MTDFMFNDAKRAFLNGQIDWENAIIRCMLLKSTFNATAAKDDNFLSTSIAASRVLGAGAANIDQTIVDTTLTLFENSGQNRVEARCGDATFPSVPDIGGGVKVGSCCYFVEPLVSPADANRIPLFYFDTAFGSGITASGSNITVRPNATGLFYLG